MILRRGECYYGEESVILWRGQCVTEERMVCY